MVCAEPWKFITHIRNGQWKRGNKRRSSVINYLGSSKKYTHTIFLWIIFFSIWFGSVRMTAPLRQWQMRRFIYYSFSAYAKWACMIFCFRYAFFFSLVILQYVNVSRVIVAVCRCRHRCSLAENFSFPFPFYFINATNEKNKIIQWKRTHSNKSHLIWFVF